MSAFSKLINVQFEDATAYPSSVSGDIVLLPFWHFWGKVNGVDALAQTEFMQTYAESLPPVATYQAKENLKEFLPLLRNYVECKRAFAAGATAVVNCRVLPVTKTVLDKDHTLKIGGKDIAAFKFSGVPTCLDLGLADDRYYELVARVFVDSSIDEVVYQLVAIDQETDVETLIETFTGSADPSNYNSESNPYIGKLVEDGSILFKDFHAELLSDRASASPGTADYEVNLNADWGSDTPASNPMDLANTYTAELIEKWKDAQVTNFTVFLMPSYETAVRSILNGIAAERKTINTIIAYPVTEPYTKADIITYFNTVKNVPDPTFFTLFMHGREKVKAFNNTYILDGKAAWAGRISSVAAAVRTNQMPSAWKYGGVDAVIDKSLTFNEVIELHELGINSLFLSNVGPCFFGIKAIYSRQTSYFAKANVSRVTAEILRAVLPEVLTVIHSEVVSDPIERAKFQVTLNGIIDDHISRGNIKPMSTANVGDDINTDKMTKGGEVLNVILDIYFKKLAERVNIKVVATDSSVNVSIS